MSFETFGPILSDKGVTFRLWAPAARRVDLMLDRPLPMPRDGDWFTVTVPDAQAGTRYRFRIDGELDIPDPGSRFQPDDVHGASEVIDQRYPWKETSWKGRPWHEAVIYELHVGTFTPQGTYRGVIDKLDHLASLGITSIELMPLADFPGRWNWGYDGVLPFAPDSVYGRPDDLKALIDAAHARGLMVFLDVVYNHFGPEGNYLHRIAPQFFSDKETPWGGAIDYNRPEVRAFAVENAVYWLRDFRFDGLRLDAVHAIVDAGTPNVLHDISKAAGSLARESGRHIHLMLENDDNAASLLEPAQLEPDGCYRAQWNDDYHHAFHVLLTGEHQGYYKDYIDPFPHVARCVSEGFSFQGAPSPHRQGLERGEPSADLPPLAFVNFLQNHDQIGNRAKGERLTRLVKPEAIEAALAILLLSPAPPMLFMGEEWGALEPFPFFCDFSGDLANAVRTGRKKEFAEAYEESGGEIPDPLAESTMRLARLNWDALRQEPHARRLALTRDLLRIRRQHVAPFSARLKHAGTARFEKGVLVAAWENAGQRLTLVANLAEAPAPMPADARLCDTCIWGEAPTDLLPRWSVYAARGGG